MFPQTLGTKGTFRVWHLDQQAFDRRHVTNGGDQIVMQVFRPARDIFLHHRKADALGHPALDLPFGKLRVDGAAHVMGGGDFQQAQGAKGGVNLQLHHLRAIAIKRIGLTLPVFIKPRGWRIIGFLGRQRIAEGIGGQAGQINLAPRAALGHGQNWPCQRQPRAIPCIRQPQDCAAQAFRRRLGRAARNKGLPTGRGFARIRGQRGIWPDQRDLVQGQAQRLGRDLGDHGVRPLADIRRPLMQDNAALMRERDADGRWVGQ